MTPDELAYLGTAAWGRDWPKRLAAALHRHETTVWRWRQGETRIHAAEADHIRRVCAEARLRCRGRADPVAGLVGRRILIAEDEAIIALDTATMLAELGCVPIGPAYDIESALRLAETADLDAAMLDVRLDRLVTPAALALTRRGVPILFATGFADRLPMLLPASLHGRPVLPKPYDAGRLAGALAEILACPALI